MPRVCFYIDGFNLYHSIVEDAKTKQCRWLDIRALAAGLLLTTETLVSVAYFTSVPFWNNGKVKRQDRLVRALRNSGVEVVFGRFAKVEKICEADCGQLYWTNEEKETDVNISTRLLTDAAEDRFDWAFLVTGDSDQVPTIKTLHRVAPAKRVCAVFPPSRHSVELKNAADRHMQLGRKHFLNNRFPVSILLPGGHSIECPDEWRWEPVPAPGAGGN